MPLEPGKQDAGRKPGQGRAGGGFNGNQEHFCVAQEKVRILFVLLSDTEDILSPEVFQ